MYGSTRHLLLKSLLIFAQLCFIKSQSYFILKKKKKKKKIMKFLAHFLYLLFIKENKARLF